ncbi:Ubiquitin [Oopsacas minuta]|uniref:Ubiquitin n=1 Tax=Oopsacas minuta TaxID=111878 RepID=A0AAV7KHM7_9METZ|nr:Ubiquitin [Oopsacas minuta]
MEMDTIFILGLSTKVYTINIEKGELKVYTIGKLKSDISAKCGIKVEHQRLLYAGKQLEEMRNGFVMNAQDYGITNNSTIMLVIRLPGGM